MPRTPRPYQPGTAYHLTTRTQGQLALFTPAIRNEMLDMLADSLRITDVTLIAHSIMPNHLHLVIQHRVDTMGQLMQRFLCRVALRVQKRHGIEGHVFERPYCHVACLSPKHLRNAIAYTNLNAVRAGLCDKPSDYPWCSATAYLGLESPGDPIHSFLHRPYWLFADPECASPTEEIASYQTFLNWRLERDVLKASGTGDIDLPQCPLFRNDVDERWATEFPTPIQRLPEVRTRATEDLRDIARRTLAQADSSVTLLEIRTTRGPQQLVDLRWTMIRRMAAAGHPGHRIADFFGMSKAAVSYALTRSRLRTGHT